MRRISEGGCCLAAATLALALAIPDGQAQDRGILRLRSGREVQLVDGRLRGAAGEELLVEALRFLAAAKLDLAADNLRVIREAGDEALHTPARDLLERIRRIEYGSFAILGSGERLQGKLTVALRTDLLGLEGKEPVPLSSLQAIDAIYTIRRSDVTLTEYVQTTLKITFRDGRVARGNITRPVEVTLELPSGETRSLRLGHEYQLLTGQGPADVAAMTRDAVARVVVYPDLLKHR